MARLRIPRLSYSTLATLFAATSLILPANSLYFYIDGTTPKCFFEELPKETLVVGPYPAASFLHLSHDRTSIPSPLSLHLSHDRSSIPNFSLFSLTDSSPVDTQATTTRKSSTRRAGSSSRTTR